MNAHSPMPRLLLLISAAAALACGGGSADFDLAVVPGTLSAVQGGSVAAAVNVARENGLEGDITVELANPPPGVSADPIIIPKSADSGVLNVHVGPDADTTQSLSLSVTAIGATLSHSVSVPLTVRGLPGSLDQGFGDRGRVVYGLIGPFSSVAYAIAVQPDGKIVVAGNGTNPQQTGNFLVSRFNPDGSHDTAFARGTNVFAPINGSCNLLALQQDGKILVGGTNSTNHISVARLLPDGTLDASFGTAGVAEFAVSSYVDAAVGIAVQQDQKIVVGVDAYANGGPYQFAAVRLDSSGALDPSFGVGGKVLVPSYEASSSDEELGFALQPDGKVLLVGATDAVNAPLVVRLDASGNPDPAFNGGWRLLTGTWNGNGVALAVQPGGGILVVGNAVNGAASEIGVARLEADGTFDSAFGVDGFTMISVDSNDFARAVTLLPDGNIAVVGSATNGGLAQLFTAKLDAQGQLAPLFGSDGTETLALGSGSAAFASTAQADGKLLIAGEMFGTSNHWVVARLWQ